MFVEPPLPKSLADSAWVRIGDHRVPRERHPNGGWGLAAKRRSFSVHVDELTLSPVQPKNAASRLPTLASATRAERAKTGQRDVGDDVAALLRACGSLGAVYEAGAKFLGVPVAELHTKYDKLNPGQQRMVIGNRMRALAKKHRKDS